MLNKSLLLLVFLIGGFSNLSLAAKEQPILREDVQRAMAADYYELFGFKTRAIPYDEAFRTDLAIRYKSLRHQFSYARAARAGDASVAPQFRRFATRLEVEELWRQKIKPAIDTLRDENAKAAYDAQLRREWEQTQKTYRRMSEPSEVSGFAYFYSPVDQAERESAQKTGEIKEEAVERNLHRLGSAVNLRSYLEKLYTTDSLLLADPNFQEALRRYISALCELRFDPTAKTYAPLWKRIMTESYLFSVVASKRKDPLFEFYQQNYTETPSFLMKVTGDRETHLGLMLLILDQLHRVGERPAYLDMLSFVISRYGHVQPADENILRLLDSHSTATNVLDLFMDNGGAGQILQTSRDKNFRIGRPPGYLDLLVSNSVSRYIQLKRPYEDPDYAEFTIRSRIYASSKWRRLMPEAAELALHELTEIYVGREDLTPGIQSDFALQKINEANSREEQKYFSALLKSLDNARREHVKALEAADQLAKREARQADRRARREQLNQQIASEPSWGKRNLKRVMALCYDLFLAVKHERE